MLDTGVYWPHTRSIDLIKVNKMFYLMSERPVTILVTLFLVGFMLGIIL